MATLKPTTPLLTPNKEALKPTSPLHPKTAPKNTDFAPAKVMAVSIPHRYQRAKVTAVSPPTGTSAQRQQRFQTTGPAGL